MHTIPASTILEDAYRMMGWDPALLEDVEIAQARQAFSKALQSVWESWWWEKLMQEREIALAPEFRTTDTPDPGLWPEGYLCFEPISNWYYVCIKPGGTAQPPIDPANPYTNLSTGGLGWNVLLTDWAVWCEPHALPEWISTGTFQLGSQTQRKGKRYQSIVDNNTGNDPENNESFWLLVPDLELTLPFIDPTSDPDTDALRGPYGLPRSFSQLDPRRTPAPVEYNWEPTPDGHRVIGMPQGKGRVWASVRRPTPVITADPFDAAATYTAIQPEEQVYDS